MKNKILLFLILCSSISFAQVSTGQEQEFDYGIKNNSAQTVSDPVFVTTQGADGTYGKITAKNLLAIKSSLSTGLIKNGAITISGDPTKFNVTSGIGIISNFDDPENPISTIVNFPAFNGVTPTYLTTGNITYIAINSTPAIVMQATPFTAIQRRDLIELGAVIHSNLTTINVINNLSSPANASTNQLHDLFDIIGALNLSGNVYSANGVNLQLNKSAGMIGKRGVNFINDWKDPHRLSQGQETALSFRYRTQNGTEFGDRINLDPALYDLNNVLTAVPNNKFTIQTVVMFQTGLTRILYGQQVYDDLQSAKNAIFTRNFVIEPNSKDNGIIRSYVIMRNTTTSLQNIADATILEAQKFGGVASGGVALTLANIVTALGYTPENVANKSDSFTVSSSTTYSSTKALVDGLGVVQKDIAYVDANGNDATAILGNIRKPYLTIDAALDALPSTGGVVKIGVGVFNSPTESKIKSNTAFIGSKEPITDAVITVSTPASRPTYTVPTRLVNGTILRGQFSILNKNNIRVENLGVDVGSYWVDTFNGGSKVGGLVLASIAPTIPIYNCSVNNVTILGYSASTADHCFLFENIHDSQFSNLTSYYNTHGLVLKGYNLLLDGYNGYSHGADALIVKSDTYAPSKYISANNINATSMSGYESAGIILEEGVLGTSPLEYVNLSNVNISYTSFGIRNTNTIKNVNISNVNMFNVSGNGFQFNTNATDVNIGNHNLKTVTTPYAITGTSVYFNPKTDGFLASGYVPKSNGNNIFSNSEVFSDVNGNVGIGTLTPSNYGGFKTFAMSGVSGSVFELMTNGTTGLQLFSDAINTTIEERRNASISLKTNGIERANISGVGVVKVNNLAGTGNRTVVADASGNLSATGVGYRVYTALLSQSGTSAPVATVLENTLGGTVVWSRNSLGNYLATLNGAFTANKSVVFISPSSNIASYQLSASASINNVNVISTNASGELVEFSASGTSFEIRVYNFMLLFFPYSMLKRRKRKIKQLN